MDDVLSALDVHTARWIVDKCFQGELLRGRTVILVTHNLAMAGPIAQHIVSISSTGAITSEATIADVLSHNVELREEAALVTAQIEKADEDIAEEAKVEANPDAKGKLVADEEVELGFVSLAASAFLCQFTL